MTDQQDITCRGSIALGAACMKCRKCKAEMDAAIVPSVTPEQNMQAIRAKFTANAEEFDSLLMQVLEENKRLHAELLYVEGYLEEAVDSKAHGFLMDPLPLLNDVRKFLGKQALEEK